MSRPIIINLSVVEDRRDVLVSSIVSAIEIELKALDVEYTINRKASILPYIQLAMQSDKEWGDELDEGLIDVLTCCIPKCIEEIVLETPHITCALLRAIYGMYWL